MNTENLDTEHLKKTWHAMGKSLGMQYAPDNNPENLDKMKTALDRLRDKYCRFWAIALLMPFPSYLVFSEKLSDANHSNINLGVVYAIYFLICFLMDLWLWNGVRNIDPLRMGVSQVAEKAAYYRRKHLIFVIILIPMATALIGFTGYVFSADIYFLTGMATGGVVGIIIGTIQFRRFMADYKNLTE